MLTKKCKGCGAVLWLKKRAIYPGKQVQQLYSPAEQQLSVCGCDLIWDVQIIQILP